MQTQKPLLHVNDIEFKSTSTYQLMKKLQAKFYCNFNIMGLHKEIKSSLDNKDNNKDGEILDNKTGDSKVSSKTGDNKVSSKTGGNKVSSKIGDNKASSKIGDSLQITQQTPNKIKKVETDKEDSSYDHKSYLK